ncbi:MAG TPA: dipeptidase [Candidatus Paceibacterota bacterium]|nr:dipeptidase [Candidatus Paceibacterota bacterium]
MLTFDSHDDNYIAELSQYVAIPSVSRDASAETMQKAAEWLAAQLSFANARVVPTSGHPVVRGEWLGAPDAPTILVYGHYDVQPTGDLAEWHTPPFELIRDGDVIRGRGVTDDKGPVLIVLKVAQAFLAQEGKLPLNVKFLFEGEEEIGSPNLPEYVRAHVDELAADLVISADGAMWRPTEPSLSVASKGLVTFDLEVSGAKEDLHSGRYGGTVANPVHVLSEILAGLHNRDGSVAIEGFYAGIPEMSSERRAEIAKVAFSDAEYMKTLGIDEVFGEAGYSTIERLWERPTLEINGVQAGGKYTVIPHVATAHISCRLVPGQFPEKVLDAIRKHIEKIKHDGVKIAMRADHGGVPAYTIPTDHPANRAAAAALEAVYPGETVLFAVIGGTLPATALFEDVLGIKTLFFSFATADEKHHAPNEFMRIKRLREGMHAWEVLWRFLADGPHKLAIVGK